MRDIALVRFFVPLLGYALRHPWVAPLIWASRSTAAQREPARPAPTTATGRAAGRARCEEAEGDNMGRA